MTFLGQVTVSIKTTLAFMIMNILKTVLPASKLFITNLTASNTSF